MAALLIQIGTNLANDYFDFKKGADTEQRLGPTRVTQAGLVKPGEIKSAIFLVFGLAVLCCIGLIIRGGWPIAVLAVLSILSGIFYTAGPRPLGYLGLGEIFVFIFFGLVAVGGTYYVQSFEINPAVILAGAGPGFLSSAILAVNNLRDIETDRASGKRTLAVRFGKGFAQMEYTSLIALASLMPVGIYFLTLDNTLTLAAAGILLPALPAIHAVYTYTDGRKLNNILAYTGLLLLLYSAWFAIGWVL
jgi:1,4-dihydroxy-2-naphthoate octaprenyltransferase